jgi:hypothetical protein
LHAPLDTPQAAIFFHFKAFFVAAAILDDDPAKTQLRFLRKLQPINFGPH